MSIAIQLRSVSKLSGCVVSVGSTRSAAGSCLAIVRVRLPIPSPISKTVVRASLPAPQRLGFPREAMGTETAVRATIGFEEASVRAGMPARTFRTQSVHGLDDHSTKSPCRGSGPRPGRRIVLTRNRCCASVSIDRNGPREGRGGPDPRDRKGVGNDR